jgi:WD40 repeat protein
MSQIFAFGDCSWLSICLDGLDTQSFASSQVVCRAWLAEARNTPRYMFTHLVNNEAMDLYGHEEAVVALLILPKNKGSDNSIMVSASEDTTIKVWNLQSGSAVCTLQGHQSMVIEMTYSDGRLLSIGFDHALCIWDTTSWELLHKLNIPCRYDTCFAVAVVGKGQRHICVATEQSTILVWELET